MNMSYCRFRNTSLDLQDCIDAINNGEINDLSRDEQQAFVNLIMQCKEVAENFEDYDDYELEDFIKEQQEEI